AALHVRHVRAHLDDPRAAVGVERHRDRMLDHRLGRDQLDVKALGYFNRFNFIGRRKQRHRRRRRTFGQIRWAVLHRRRRGQQRAHVPTTCDQQHRHEMDRFQINIYAIYENVYLPAIRMTDPALATPATLPLLGERRPWYAGVTPYQWLVLAIASAGWIFDNYENQIFVVTRSSMLSELLHQPVTSRAVKYYGDSINSVFLIGGATGGILFGVIADRFGRARAMIGSILVYAIF